MFSSQTVLRTTRPIIVSRTSENQTVKFGAWNLLPDLILGFVRLSTIGSKDYQKGCWSSKLLLRECIYILAALRSYRY